MKTRPVTFIYTFHDQKTNCVVFARKNRNHDPTSRRSYPLRGSSARRLHRAVFTMIDQGWRLEPSSSGGYFAWPVRIAEGAHQR